MDLKNLCVELRNSKVIDFAAKKITHLNKNVNNNKDNNIVEELDNIVDDNLRYKIIHEEIKEIKVERIDDSNAKLHVMYMFDDSYVIYDLETRKRKVYLCGEEIKFDYLKRFEKKR